MGSQVGFEVALQQLEQTVVALEGGDLGLDGALKTYEQGVGLLRYCYGLLDGAERTVAVLKAVGGSGAEATPFDATATAEFGTGPEVRSESGDLEDEDDLPY